MKSVLNKAGNRHPDSPGIASLMACLLILLPAAVQAAAMDNDTGRVKMTIYECIEMSMANYPQIEQAGLIDEAERYDLSNAGLNWVPRFTVSGKASYQSEVVEMPFEIPGYNFNLPHDQYSAVGELSQQIWDGGVTRNMKDNIRAGADIQRRQLEVNLYSVKERVENIFLGILLIDKQIAQNRILEKNLLRSKDEVMALLENGMSYRSDLNIVEVNILNCRQKISQLEADRNAYICMLGKFTGKDLNNTEFEEPAADFILDSIRITRPELRLYDARLAQNKVSRAELQTRISPKLNLSIQGGIGQPGLNMLKEGFSPYYIAGIKLQWNFGDLYTRKNDIRRIENERKSIENERETFLFNTSMDAIQEISAVEKAQDVLEQDRKIIALRESIRISGEEQYSEGVIKMTELMDMIDDEHDAKVAESIHQVQLLMEIFKLKNTIGK